MFCKKCGKEIPDEALFCPYCGQETIDKSESFKSEKEGTGQEFSSTSNSFDPIQQDDNASSKPESVRRNLATAALVLGILSIAVAVLAMLVSGVFMFVAIGLGIIAIVFGVRANSGSDKKVTRHARAGLILGIIGIICVVVGILIAVLWWDNRTATKDTTSADAQQVTQEADEVNQDSAELTYTIGDEISSSEANFTLLDFQLTPAIALDKDNYYEPVSADYSLDCYKAEDGYVLAYIECSYQYTGTQTISRAYRSYDDSSMLYQVEWLEYLIDLNWDDEYTFTGKDYCVGTYQEGDTMEPEINPSYVWVERDLFSAPVTFKCCFKIPSQVTENDTSLTLTFYLPTSEDTDTSRSYTSGSPVWILKTTPYTFLTSKENNAGSAAEPTESLGDEEKDVNEESAGVVDAGEDTVESDEDVVDVRKEVEKGMKDAQGEADQIAEDVAKGMKEAQESYN